MYGAVFKQKSDNAKHDIIVSHLGVGVADKQAKEDAKHRKAVKNIKDNCKKSFANS